MNQQILEKVLEAFPQLEIKEVDIENSRHRIMRDFFYCLVVEFGIDLDNVTRVQLCQSISGDDEMISTINLMSCIITLIPGPRVGLFDLLAPSQNFLWKEMDLCLRFYDFSDSIVNGIYNLASPMAQSKKSIKQYNEGVAEFSSVTNDTIVRINHETRMLEEVEAAIHPAEQIGVELMDEKKATEHKTHKIALDVQMKLRIKQQLTASINELNNKIKLMKNIFNHSVNCDEQIKGLSEQVAKEEEKKAKINGSIDEEKKFHKDLAELNAIFVKRCPAVEQILKDITKIKELKEEKMRSGVDQTVTNNKVVKRLDEINRQISTATREKELMLESHIRENELLNNTIKLTMDNVASNSNLLLKIESEKRDLEPVINKIKTLEIEAQKLRKSYKEEETRLVQMVEKAMQKRRNHFEHYRAQSITFSNTMKNLKGESERSKKSSLQ